MHFIIKINEKQWEFALWNIHKLIEQHLWFSKEFALFKVYIFAESSQRWQWQYTHVILVNVHAWKYILHINIWHHNPYSNLSMKTCLIYILNLHHMYNHLKNWMWIKNLNFTFYLMVFTSRYINHFCVRSAT